MRELRCTPCTTREGTGVNDGPRRRLRLDVRVDVVDGLERPQVVPRVDGSVLGLDLPTRADSDESGLGIDPAVLLGRRGLLLPAALGDTEFPAEPPTRADLAV